MAGRHAVMSRTVPHVMTQAIRPAPAAGVIATPMVSKAPTRVFIRAGWRFSRVKGPGTAMTVISVFSATPALATPAGDSVLTATDTGIKTGGNRGYAGI